MARIERVEAEEIVEGPEAIEAAVVGIFETLLQQGHLRPTDNFFELGGDSVLAVTLVVEIERRLGVVLARSTLLDAPTPRQLVKAVLDARDNVEPDVLVPIHPEGSGPVIFCVHSMRGEVTFPRKLAHAMGGHRPFYGVRVVGLRSGEIMLPTAEEMASQYEAEINALQPNGPYLFIGQCGTSVIALELAQRFAAAGREVLGLVLIDPGVGNLAPWMSGSGAIPTSHLERARERAQGVHDEMRRDPSMDGGKRRTIVKMGLGGVVAGYRPKPYAGPVLLIHSAARSGELLDQARGYPTLLARLEEAQIGPNHPRLFVDHLDELAEAVNAFFNRVAPIRVNS
jgi:acyl carrier protein